MSKSCLLTAIVLLLLLLSLIFLEALVVNPDTTPTTAASHLYERKFKGALCDGVTGLACNVGIVQQTFLYNETELYYTNGLTKSMHKYNLKTKVVETIVGTGSYETIPLTAADLFASPKDTNIGEPISLAVDQGFVYFTTNENNDVIFKVNSDGSGFISIFAGVPGQTGYRPSITLKNSSPLSGPTFLNVYSNGDLVFYEREICTIRVISGSNITTLAGNGLCNSADTNNTLSNGITAMTVSTDQILYIATSTGEIMKWNGIKFVTITNNQDYISSMAANPDFIYITTDANELSSISVSFASETVLLGPALGYSVDGQILGVRSTASPRGLSISKETNILYYVEGGNSRIRTYSNAVLGTIIGYAVDSSAPNGRLIYPTKMTIVGNNIYVVDPTSTTVTRFDVSNGSSQKVASITDCTSITSIGNMVYVGSTRLNTVYQIDGTRVTTFAGNGTNLSTGDGQLANSSAISAPLALASDSTGSVYILSTKVIRKVDRNGIISTLFTYYSSGLNDIFINSKDQILISDVNGYVYELSCSFLCSYTQIAGLQNGFARSVGYNRALDVRIKPLSISSLLNFKTGQWVNLYISEATTISVVSEGLIRPLYYNAKNSPLVSLKTIQVSGFAVNQTNGVIYISGPYGISTLTPYTLPKEICPCSGNGICYSSNPNLCSCLDGYGGETCSIPTCAGILANSPHVCSNGQGVCIDSDTCVCKSGFVGSQCQIPFCVGSTSNETFGCSGQVNNSSSNAKQEVIVEVVETVKDLNSKNLTFSTIDTIGVVFPSNFSSYISQAISQISNIPITLVSSVVDSTVSNSSVSNPIQNPVKPQLVVSPVITLSLFTNSSLKISVKNLEKPIELLFTNIPFTKSDKNYGIESYSNLTCMFFDTSINDWNDEGISSTILSIHNSDSQLVLLSIKCETKHLTSFAVIDKNYKKQVSTPNSGGNKLPATASEFRAQLEGLSENEIIAISVSLGGSCLVIGTLVVLISVVCVIVMKRKRNSSSGV